MFVATIRLLSHSRNCHSIVTSKFHPEKFPTSMIFGCLPPYWLLFCFRPATGSIIPLFHNRPNCALTTRHRWQPVDQVERKQMRPSRGSHSLSVLLSTHFPHFMPLEIGSGDLMTNDMWNARHFGAHDKPRCANCGNRTFLARRSPASDYALHLERQTFACLECNLDFERVVGADGKAVRSTALASS